MRLATMLSGLAASVCAVAGIRTEEQPAYRVLARVGVVEIREYGPRLAAETTVSGDEMRARSEGFSRLAGFIFGGNRTRADIAMTAPVAAAPPSEVIAMTAPVASAPDGDGGGNGRVIRFFMPAKYTEATLPAPTDPSVRIVTVPGETMAVYRYSGSTGPAATAEARTALLSALKGTAWRPDGAIVDWFYDPPWTLPPLRRNEAAVKVTRDTGEGEAP